MPKTNLGFDSGGHIGKISFEVQNVHAIGGPEFPKLIFMLELQMSPLKPYPPPDLIHPLTWMFLSGEFCSPEQRAVASFRDEVNFYADASHSPERQFRLEIPLDLITVERIEQSREGDLCAALNLRGFFAVHISGGTGVQRFETTRTEPINFTIPKSQWVEKLLPQLGYGRLELIEVRISTGIRAEGLPKAVQEIREARTYLANGDWDQVVSHCRNTLEAILDSRPLQLPSVSKFGVKVNTFIHEHLASLGEKQSKLLAEEMNLLWEVCSKAAHPNPPDYFKRADANFIDTPALKIVAEYDNLESIIAGVEAGRGVAVLYQSLGRIACKRAVLRPLKPVPQPPPIVIAYRKERVSATVAAFVEAAKTAKLK